MQFPIRIILLALLVYIPSLSLAEPKGSEVLRVGVILPLTGRASGLGNAIRNGMELAMESLTDDVRSRIALAFEDDASDSKGTVSAYQKLQMQTGYPVIISAMSNAGAAISPITERDGVTHIALAFDTSISHGKKQTFTFWARLEDLAPTAITELARRGHRKIAVIVTSHEGNLAMRQALLSAADPSINFVMNEEVLPSDTDFSSVVTRLRSSTGIDVIANLLHPAHAGIFAKRAQSLGVQVPQFALSSFEDSGVRKTAGESLRGQWYTAARYSPEFLDKYRSRFPDSSISGGAYGHDAILMLARAARASTTAPGVAEALRAVKNFSGAVTEISADGENGFRMAVGIKVVGQDGL